MRFLKSFLRRIIKDWEAVVLLYDGVSSVPVSWYEISTGRFVEVTPENIHLFPGKVNAVPVSPSEVLTHVGEAAQPLSSEEFVTVAFDAGEHSYEVSIPEAELAGFCEVLIRSGSVAKVFSLFSCYRSLKEGCYVEVFFPSAEKGWLVEIHVKKGIERARVFCGGRDEVVSEVLNTVMIAVQSGETVFFFSAGMDGLEDRVSSLVKTEGGTCVLSEIPHFATVPASRAVEYHYQPITKLRERFRTGMLLTTLAAGALVMFLIQDVRALKSLVALRKVKKEIEEYRRAADLIRNFVNRESARVVPAVFSSRTPDFSDFLNRLFSSVPRGVLLEEVKLTCREWECRIHVVLRVPGRPPYYDIAEKRLAESMKKMGLSLTSSVAAKGKARYIILTGRLR